MDYVALVDRSRIATTMSQWLVALSCLSACRDDGRSSDADSSTTGSTTGIDTQAMEASSSASDTAGPSSSVDDDTSAATSIAVSSESGTTGVDMMCGDGEDVAGDTCFAPYEVLLTGRPTAAVALADLDGDTAFDIVAGHLDGWSVWLGDGEGGLGEPFGDMADPIGAIAIAPVDDDDDWPDLVAAHPQQDSITVRLGSGDGAFGPAATIDVDGDGIPGNASPRAIALADLDGDDDTDVAVVGELDGRVRVFFQAAGVFDPGAELTIGGAPIGLAAGPFVGASGLDLAVVNFAGASVGLVAHTDGQSFEIGASLAVGSGPAAITAIDLDGDDAIDLATADAVGNSASVLLRLGDGFAAARVLGLGGQPRAVAAGDFDGDGAVDLALALDAANAVGVLLRDSAADSFEMLPAVAIATHARPGSIAAADLDGDGIDEIVTGSAAAGGGVALLRSDP